MTVIRDWADKIKPPRFDRCVVKDAAIFSGIRRVESSPGLFGIPVVLDETLPENVIELRMGDEVVKRVVLHPRPAGAPERRRAVPVCPHCHTSCERGFCSCGWVVPDSERVWPVER